MALRRVGFWFLFLASPAFLAATASMAAGAQKQLTLDLQGSQVDLQADGATLNEVLSQLGSEAGFQVLGEPLQDPQEPVHLTFSGSVPDTLGRLLRRYNYVIRYQDQGEVSPGTKTPLTISKVFLLGPKPVVSADDDFDPSILPGATVGADAEYSDSGSAAPSESGTDAGWGAQSNAEAPVKTLGNSPVGEILHRHATAQALAQSGAAGASNRSRGRSVSGTSGGNRPGEAETTGSMAGQHTGSAAAVVGPEALMSDPDIQRQLAAATRQAQQELGALVDGLRQAERSLQMQSR